MRVSVRHTPPLFKKNNDKIVNFCSYAQCAAIVIGLIDRAVALAPHTAVLPR